MGVQRTDRPEPWGRTAAIRGGHRLPGRRRALLLGLDSVRDSIRIGRSGGPQGSRNKRRTGVSVNHSLGDGLVQYRGRDLGADRHGDLHPDHGCNLGERDRSGHDWLGRWFG